MFLFFRYFEALDGEAEESVGEDVRVRGLDVRVEVWRGLFEDEGPEVGDAGDEGGAFGVEWAGEAFLVDYCCHCTLSFFCFFFQTLIVDRII